MIGPFRGKYEFLSNFYRGVDDGITIDGILFDNTEVPYQISKFLDPDLRRAFYDLTPGQSKRLAKAYKNEIRPDWTQVNIDIMCQLLKQKFKPEGWLMGYLVETEGEELVELNTWHDNFWGNCTCGRPACQMEGENWLGRLLMEIREEEISRVSS